MPTPPWEWTGEQDVILRRMWSAGKLLREIAPVIGCNVGQVANRREVLGLRGRPARGGDGPPEGEAGQGAAARLLGSADAHQHHRVGERAALSR